MIHGWQLTADSRKLIAEMDKLKIALAVACVIAGVVAKIIE